MLLVLDINNLLKWGFRDTQSASHRSMLLLTKIKASSVKN